MPSSSSRSDPLLAAKRVGAGHDQDQVLVEEAVLDQLGIVLRQVHHRGVERP